MNSSFIGVYENGASSDYCQRMIQRLDQLIKESSGHLGQEDNFGVENRKDIARFFDRDDQQLAQETNQILDVCLKKYMDEYPALGMNRFCSHMVKVQKTEPKGGFHRWHSEQGSNSTSASRCLVWMIYLNTCPEGEGTTEFLEQGQRIEAKEGTVVFFPAAWTHTHRGNPVYSGDKYITTGWYYLT